MLINIGWPLCHSSLQDPEGFLVNHLESVSIKSYTQTHKNREYSSGEAGGSCCKCFSSGMESLGYIHILKVPATIRIRVYFTVKSTKALVYPFVTCRLDMHNRQYLYSQRVLGREPSEHECEANSGNFA